MSACEAFRCYLDESEVPGGGLYVVGGFSGASKMWDELELEWMACLPAGIPFFHATDCFSGKQSFLGIDIPKRVALLDNLTDLLTFHEIKLIAYGIDSKTYQQLAPKAKCNDFLGNKYAAAFGGAVDLACHSMGCLPTPQTIRDILEKGEETAHRLVKHARYYWLLLAESHLTRRLFGSMIRRIDALPLPTG